MSSAFRGIESLLFQGRGGSWHQASGISTYSHELQPPHERARTSLYGQVPFDCLSIRIEGIMQHSFWSPYCSYCCDGPCDCEAVFYLFLISKGWIKLNIQIMLASVLRGGYRRFEVKYDAFRVILNVNFDFWDKQDSTLSSNAGLQTKSILTTKPGLYSLIKRQGSTEDIQTPDTQTYSCIDASILLDIVLVIVIRMVTLVLEDPTIIISKETYHIFDNTLRHRK